MPAPNPVDSAEFPEVLHHELAVIRDKRRAERLDALNRIGRDGDYSDVYARIAVETATEEVRQATKARVVAECAQGLFGVASEIENGPPEPSPAQLDRLILVIKEMPDKLQKAVSRLSPQAKDPPSRIDPMGVVGLRELAAPLTKMLQQAQAPGPPGRARLTAYRSVRAFLFSTMPVRDNVAAAAATVPLDGQPIRHCEEAERNAKQACDNARQSGKLVVSVVEINRAAEAAAKADQAGQYLKSVIPNLSEESLLKATAEAVEAAIEAVQKALQATLRCLDMENVQATSAAEQVVRGPGRPEALAASSAAALQTAASLQSSYSAAEYLRLSRGIAGALEFALQIRSRLPRPDAQAPGDARNWLADSRHSLADAAGNLIGALNAIQPAASPSRRPRRAEAATTRPAATGQITSAPWPAAWHSLWTLAQELDPQTDAAALDPRIEGLQAAVNTFCIRLNVAEAAQRQRPVRPPPRTLPDRETLRTRVEALCSATQLARARNDSEAGEMLHQLARLIHPFDGTPLEEGLEYPDLEHLSRIRKTLENRRTGPPQVWSAEEAKDILSAGVHVTAQAARAAALWAWAAERETETILRWSGGQLDEWMFKLQRRKGDGKSDLLAEGGFPTPDSTIYPLEQARAVALNMDLAGLAFSGGGIRSATFALGILQGLAQMRLLACFDYLSTVSGGGYIGGWLAAWVRREKSLTNVERQLDPSRLEQAQANRGVRQDEASPESPLNPVLPLARNYPLDEEPEPIFHLRSYSRYLTPRPGWFSLDPWTLASIYLRNFLVNQLCLLPLALLMVFAARALVALFAQPVSTPPSTGAAAASSLTSYAISFGEGLSWAFTILLLLSAALALISYSVERSHIEEAGSAGKSRMAESRNPTRPAWTTIAIFTTAIACAWLFSYDPSSSGHGALRYPGDKQARSLGSPQWPFLAGAILVSGILYAWRLIRNRRRFGTPIPREHRRHALYLLVGDLALGMWASLFVWVVFHFLIWPLDRERLPIVTFGIPALVLALVLASYLEMAVVSLLVSEYQREFASRAEALLLSWAAIWLIGFLSIFYLPQLLRHPAIGSAAAALWAVISGLGVWVGRLSPIVGQEQARSIPWLRLLAGVAPPVFLVGLLAAISRLAEIILSFLLASTAVSPSLELVCLLLLIVICALFVFAFNYYVDVNSFSLHAVYRNRLARCYLGASRRKLKWQHRIGGPVVDDLGRKAWFWRRGRGGAPTNADKNASARRANYFSGFDPGDDFPLCELRGVALDNNPPPAGTPPLVNDGYRGPYPLFNTALNLVSGNELAFQDRKAAAFILAPYYCGGKQTGYAPTPSDESTAKNLTLAMAMTTSGAAVDPNMGIWQSPALTALMTIFNARLGLWLDNPNPLSRASWRQRHFLAPRREWQAVGVSPGFMILEELMGQTSDNSARIHLSDGGHFENLGVYELIRRRCRYIVAVDATTDRHAATDNFANLLRLIRSDFGIRIDIDVSKLAPGPDKLTAWHCAVGLIRYDDVDAHAVAGVFIYLYVSLTGDEPPDVRQYADSHPHFPYQTTLDQFFTENQFESYRALGFHIVREVFCAAATDLPKETLALSADREAVRKLFAGIRRHWFPPPAGIDASFISAARLGIDQDRELRKSPELDDFCRALHPELNANGTPPIELHMVNELLKGMQSVWFGMGLDNHHAHPLNRGWMNIFRRVTTMPAFQRNWPFLRSEYSADFVRFCERVLSLAPPNVSVIRPRNNNELGKWLVDLKQMDTEFQHEWIAETESLPWLTTGRYLADRVLEASKLPRNVPPTLWLLFLRDCQRICIDPPCGLVCLGAPYRGVLADQELFVWLRGPYRNLGIARNALPEILADVGTDAKKLGVRRLVAYYPERKASGAERLHKALWMNFFFDHGFRSTRRNNPGRLAGVVTLSKDIA